MESHLERKVLHFNLKQAIEITHCVSPSFKHKLTIVTVVIQELAQKAQVLPLLKGPRTRT